MESQTEMTKAGVHRESPKFSKSAPHLVLSNGNFYGQDSWDGPAVSAFNKPPPSGLAVPTVLVMKNPTPQRDSTISSFTNAHSPRSVHGGFSSSQKPSITSYSSQTTLISIGGAREHEEGQKEKKTKLRQMYKRATMTTKALARMFSRSPGPGRGSPSGGITKRSSLKTPIPIVPPPTELLNVDPFASGSFASPYGLSPLETKRLSLTHKRTSSSPEVKPHLSTEIQKQLKRSPSISSPLGIPTSPLSTLPTQQSQESSVRGRNSPFPVNLSNISIPLPALRTSASSQSLISSTGIQATIPRSSQNQIRPPVPRVHSNGSLSAQARQTPPNPAPEQPPPALPSSLPFLTPAPVNSSGLDSNFIQRLRSKSVRETQRSRPTLAVTESPPQRPTQKLDISHGNKHSFINRETPSFLDVPPSERPRQLVQGLVELNAYVRAPEVHVIAPSPSVPSMRATFLASDPTNLGGPSKRISRAGSISAEVARREVDSSLRIDSRTAETPGKWLEFDRLPELIPQQRTKSAESSIGPSPARVYTPQASGRKPSLPLLVTQNLPSAEDPEPSSSNLRSHRSTRHIPRSPSMPSLRPDFLNAPPLMQTTGSHQEESKTHFGTMDDSHFRSPSLPDFTLNAISAGSSVLEKEKPQPLPSSITQQLKTRTRSYTRSEGRQPHIHSSPSKSPPRPSVKQSLEPLPSAPADGPVLSHPNLEGSTLSTAPSLQVPPPPQVSHLLKLRVASRPQGSIFRTPSMPDLRKDSSISGSRSHYPSSPPPPLPSTQNHSTLPLPGPDLNPGRSQGNFAHGNGIDIPTASGSLSHPPLSTAFPRPKTNLTRPKESFSFPPSKNTAQRSHTRSNKEFAKDGSWDSMGAPPKSPALQAVPTHIDRKPSYVALRSRSNSVKALGPNVPPVPINQVQRNDPRNRMVGVAL